jgi:hypothetical protein
LLNLRLFWRLHLEHVRYHFLAWEPRVEYPIRRLKPLLILLGFCGATEVAPFQNRRESRLSGNL